jgi:hypothetical protein
VVTHKHELVSLKGCLRQLETGLEFLAEMKGQMTGATAGALQVQDSDGCLGRASRVVTKCFSPPADEDVDEGIRANIPKIVSKLEQAVQLVQVSLLLLLLVLCFTVLTRRTAPTERCHRGHTSTTQQPQRG